MEAFLSLDFLVVSDMFMTPSAALADVILPAATYLEWDSIAAPPYGIPVVSAQQKVTRVGESRSDYEILSAVAEGLGQGEHFWKTEEDCLDFILKPAGLTFRDLREKGILEGSRLHQSYRKGGFATPSKKVELYSVRLKSAGFDPLPEYRPFDQKGPDPMPGSPLLTFTTWKRAPFRHSGGRQIKSLRAMHPEPVVIIHPDTARAVGVADGEMMEVRTATGAIVQKACFSSDIDADVIGLDYGWWFPENEKENLFSWDRANTNILTDNSPPWSKEMGTPRLRGIPCTVHPISRS